MSTSDQTGRFLCLSIASLFFLGCEKPPESATYEIAKEFREAALLWTTPEGWTEDVNSPAPKGASFLIEGKDGRMGKVAAMAFGKEVTMVSVANMFSRDLGLGFLTEQDLAAVSEKKTLGQHDFEIAILGGDDNASLAQRSATIALLPGENEAWLLMMIAETALAKEQRPKFEEFLGSLTVLASRAAPKNPELDSFFTPTLAAGGPPPFAPPPAAPKPEWTVPEDWEEQAISGPRIGSFAVKGEGDALLDISVTTFPGSMGGPMANLNRWRGQLGLDAAEGPVENLEYVTVREVGGRPAHFVELLGGERGMLAVMVLDEAGSWFVKAMGDGALAKAQKANFVAFIDSMRFTAP